KVLQRKAATNDQTRAGQSSRLPIAPRTGPRATQPSRGIIQRSWSFEDVEGSTLSKAIGIYAEIELNPLMIEGRRFIPLLGRFQMARNTKLVVTKNKHSQVTGDMAVTRLFCHTLDGQYEYDKDRNQFLEALHAKNILSFVVEIAFWSWRIQKEDKPYTLSSVGTLLQTFTHEMTVHAENMLDFIEDYWDYVDGKRKEPPSNLPSVSEEHQEFRSKEVVRYQYMRRRVKELKDETMKTEFFGREYGD